MPSTPTEPDDYVIARVQEALAQELNELDVTVTLTAGGAFLTGTVTTKRRCKEITELGLQGARHLACVGDERLHLRFAELRAVRACEAAAEALHAGHADDGAVDVDGHGLALEHAHTRGVHELGDHRLLVAVVVVVAEDGECGNPARHLFHF